jgi:hypothetical protein
MDLDLQKVWQSFLSIKPFAFSPCANLKILLSYFSNTSRQVRSSRKVLSSNALKRKLLDLAVYNLSHFESFRLDVLLYR